MTYFTLKIFCRTCYYKIAFFADFSVKMVKPENFLNVADFSFDVRFAKYYHFSLGQKKYMCLVLHAQKNSGR